MPSLNSDRLCAVLFLWQCFIMNFQILKKLLHYLLPLLGISLVSQPALSDAINDANQYAVRIKSLVSNSIFFDGGSGTSSGAGFLVDKERGWINAIKGILQHANFFS